MSHDISQFSPVIHRYALTGDEATRVISRALAALQPHLPAAISLYRRLQFGRFFAASHLLTNLDLSTSSSSSSSSKYDTTTAQPWLMAFVDRSCRPETESWMFATWENDTKNSNHDHHHHHDSNALSNKSEDDLADALILALVRTVAATSLPISIHQDVLDAAAAAAESTPDKDSAGLTRADYASHASNKNIMLWGAVHERTMAIMQRLDLLSPIVRAGLVSNHTFIWDVDALPALASSKSTPTSSTTTATDTTEGDSHVDTLPSLPPNLRWGELTPKHFALVRSRTGIPRQDRTLAVLPNLAIFTTNTPDNGSSSSSSSEQPVAWAFVGLDASLTTLHVEPDFRRQGLAQRLTLALFRSAHMHQFWEDGIPRWAHGVVVAGNKASAAMCRSIGGREFDRCYWLRVDLQRC